MGKKTIILLMALLFSTVTWAIGYAPTTIYGYILGEGKYDISITATDTVTGEIFPLEVNERENFYIATLTKEDDGHQIDIKLKVNVRGRSVEHYIEAELWRMHSVNITLPQDDEGSFSVITDDSPGPIITEFIRDSEDRDDFKKKYDVEEPQTESPKSPIEKPIMKVSAEDIQKKSMFFTFLLVFSLLMVIIIINNKNRLKKR